MDNFDRQMSTAVVRHQSTIKKNECRNFLCELLFTPFTERLKGPCVYGWNIEMQAVMASHSEMYEAMQRR